MPQNDVTYANHTITPRQLGGRLHDRNATPWFILDVRNAEDAARWKVEGPSPIPTVNVPYFSFIDDDQAALAKVPKDLGLAVVVCAKADSSEFVANVLRENGREAVHMGGGMGAWGDLHVPLKVAQADTYELWQVNRFGKGCLSYVVVSGGEAAVVDPSRFTDVYAQLAAERGAKITEILETHVHADHLSGGAALAKQTGANYRVLNGVNDREPELGVTIKAFEPGETQIRIGGTGGVAISARALRTPGHTPGSISYVVDDRYMLSGDTLFVQGVGRPDLGGHVEEWGRALFSTLHDVVEKLPDALTVLPAHFANVAEEDGSGVVRGNLGTLRRTAPELSIASVDEFVETMKAGVKEPPAVYGEIIRANLGLVDPGDKAAEWELGKNECAATAAKKRAAEAAAAAASSGKAA